MILKVNISEVYNWDNVIGILTVNQNVVADSNKEEYEYKRGHDLYLDHPFVIELQLVDRLNRVIFRTSDSEELQEVYNGIIEKIVLCLKGNSDYCDISEYTK